MNESTEIQLQAIKVAHSLWGQHPKLYLHMKFQNFHVQFILGVHVVQIRMDSSFIGESYLWRKRLIDSHLLTSSFTLYNNKILIASYALKLRSTISNQTVCVAFQVMFKKRLSRGLTSIYCTLKPTFGTSSKLLKLWQKNANEHPLLAWSVPCGLLANLTGIKNYYYFFPLQDYCASKFGAIGFHESLSHEIKASEKDGINMTLVCPYLVDTGMFKGCRIRWESLCVYENEAFWCTWQEFALSDFHPIKRGGRIAYDLQSSGQSCLFCASWLPTKRATLSQGALPVGAPGAKSSAYSVIQLLPPSTFPSSVTRPWKQMAYMLGLERIRMGGKVLNFSHLQIQYVWFVCVCVC